MYRTLRVFTQFFKLVNRLGLQAQVDFQPREGFRPDDQVLIVFEDYLTDDKVHIEFDVVEGRGWVVLDEVHVPLRRLLVATQCLIRLDHRDALFDQICPPVQRYQIQAPFHYLGLRHELLVDIQCWSLGDHAERFVVDLDAFNLVRRAQFAECE